MDKLDNRFDTLMLNMKEDAVYKPIRPIKTSIVDDRELKELFTKETNRILELNNKFANFMCFLFTCYKGKENVAVIRREFLRFASKINKIFSRKSKREIVISYDRILNPYIRFRVPLNEQYSIDLSVFRNAFFSKTTSERDITVSLIDCKDKYKKILKYKFSVSINGYSNASYIYTEDDSTTIADIYKGQVNNTYLDKFKTPEYKDYLYKALNDIKDLSIEEKVIETMEDFSKSKDFYFLLKVCNEREKYYA